MDGTVFSALFAIIVPVLVCAGIGFGWEKSGRPYPTEFVTTLVTNVGVPCLVFTTLVTMKLALPNLAATLGAALALIGAFAVVGAVALRLLNLQVRGYLPTLMLPNMGNMGLPLNMLAFGEAGLALAIVYFATSAVIQFTFGVALVSGTSSLRELVRIPVLYAVAAASAFVISGVDPPLVLSNTTRLLGGLTIPLMLITLGISLARLRVRSFKTSLVLSVLRLGMGFALGLGLAHLLDLDGVARGVLILQASMPVAVFSYLFAQRYERSPEEVAGAVVISTTLSFATLPLLLWFLL